MNKVARVKRYLISKSFAKGIKQNGDLWLREDEILSSLVYKTVVEFVASGEKTRIHE